MTVIEQQNPSLGSIYTIRNTEDRGRAVYASRWIPAGTTVHVALTPFVYIIKEKFKKEVCAWCFKYEHGKNCPVKQSEPHTGLCFCSAGCLQHWTKTDHDGKLAEALSSLRTNKARKVYLNYHLSLTSPAGFQNRRLPAGTG